MRRTPDKLWRDAVHEAGQAVIARALGNGNDTAFWDGAVIARMAGAEAEREIIGTCLGRYERCAQSSDLIGNDLGHQDGRGHSTDAEQLVASDELDELLARQNVAEVKLDRIQATHLKGVFALSPTGHPGSPSRPTLATIMTGVGTRTSGSVFRKARYESTVIPSRRRYARLDSFCSSRFLRG